MSEKASSRSELRGEEETELPSDLTQNVIEHRAGSYGDYLLEFQGHRIHLNGTRDMVKEQIIEVHGYKDFKPENVLFTNGTYEANFLVLSEAVDSGDEVVVIRPCWYQFAAYNLDEKQRFF